MTRVTKMGRKTYEQATPYGHSSTLQDASPTSQQQRSRAPLASQAEMESSLGFKSQRGEARRQRRERDRNTGKVCFACRKEGHRIQDCPETTASGAVLPSGGKGSGRNGKTVPQSICYRCGKSDHALKQCRLHPSKGLPFARCFVCQEQGHITSNCPTNSRGVYPSGGCCKICRSVEHLAKDCPLPDEVRLGTVVGMQSLQGSNAVPIAGGGGADDDDFHDLARVENQKRALAASQAAKKSATVAVAPVKQVAAKQAVVKGGNKKIVSF